MPLCTVKCVARLGLEVPGNRGGLYHHNLLSQRRDRSTKSVKKSRLPASERQTAFKWSNILVDAAAGGDKRPGWVHRISPFEEENRLAAALSKPAAIFSPEKAQFSATLNEEDSEETFNSDSLKDVKTGAFVTLRRSNQEMHTVVLGRSVIDGRDTLTSLSLSGDELVTFVEDVMFVIPAFVDHYLASRCGILGEVAPNKSQLQARVEVLKRMRALERMIEGAAAFVGKQFGTMYNLFKSPNPDLWTEVTVSQVADLLKPYTLPELTSLSSDLHQFVVQKCLLDREREFLVANIYESPPNRFYVRPQSHMMLFDQVTDMVRNRGRPDDCIAAFASKAREIIALSRVRAVDSWTELPSIHPSNGPAFTAADMAIIRFLRASLHRHRTIQQDPFSFGAATIVKAVGSYENVCVETRDAVILLLTDLGLLAPWADLIPEERGLAIDYPRREEPVLVDEKALIREPGSMHVTPMGPDDFYLRDPLESIRHDFGDLPVYVIDDQEAEELDDGISVEQIPSEPTSAWLHIHVADPTSVLPPSHVIFAQARERSTTKYLIEETIPMLPSLPIIKRMSLGSVSSSGKPEPVLTFSVKVNASGELVDYKVRAGLVKNVRRATYEEVDARLGHQRTLADYPFGDKPPEPPTGAQLTKADVDHLMDLKAVTNRLWDYTTRLPIFVFNFTSVNMSLAPKPLPPSPKDVSRPVEFRGFPSLTYSVEAFSRTIQGSRRIVSESMKAAARAASLFCSEHRVPVMRRAQDKFTASESEMEEILASRDECMTVDPRLGLRVGVLTPPGRNTLEPDEHWGLGIPKGEGYVRVTSPLRRFTDLVSHYQIKHALLPSSPMFSEDWIRGLIEVETEKAFLWSKTDRFHRERWAILHIHRVLNDPKWKGGPPVLDNLVAFVSMAETYDSIYAWRQTRVVIPQLALPARLIRISGPKERYLPGNAIPVRIERVDMGLAARLIVVEK